MTTGKHCINQLTVWTVLLFLLFQASGLSAEASSVGISKDIEYGQFQNERLLLDACVPVNDGNHPIVILVHGGGWIGGDKQDMHFLFKPLSEAGFTCFSIQYRLAPASRWPVCLDDVQAAIRWIKAHASVYKGDPQRIALVGYSAGGHLVCMAAGKEPVQAVVGIAPPTDHLADSIRRGGLSECLQKLFDRSSDIDAESRDLLRSISPINHVKSDLPPYLLIHGTADQSVPYAQSIAFQKALTEHSVACELITIPDAPHRISDWSQYAGGDFKPAMIQWLAKTLGHAGDSVSMTVSADGAGDYTTVQAAVDATADNSNRPTVIHIKPGIYKEIVVVPHSKRFVTFRGEDAETTVLTYNLSARMKDETGQELGTFRTPTVTIEADDFTAENITFENTAGDVGQALAITVKGDRGIFRDCRFLGWQDTIFDQNGRHYYENCYIVGHCDFIFGGGTAFFDTCHIHCLEGSYITAASTPEDHHYGYVFSNCQITGEPANSRTYLGRPWRDYARVVFLNTTMSEVIRPEGWHNWSQPNREKTAFYAEYNSKGPGAKPKMRVEWSHQLTDKQANEYTIEHVLSGEDGWNPLSNR